MQHTQKHAENLAVEAKKQHTALPPRAPVAPAAASRIKLPAATAFAAPAAASAEATGTGLTRLERETALYVLDLLAKYKEADPFRQPVDWESLGIPDYPIIIKQPMDLKTAREKVRAGAYNTMDEWRADIKRIWENCREYNGEDHHDTRCAEKLEAAVQRMEEAVRGAPRKLSAAQQRTARGGLAGRRVNFFSAGGGMPRAPREGTLLRASNTAGDGAEDSRQAGPAPHMVSSSQQHMGPASRRPCATCGGCKGCQ
ncbi:Bromodomain-containing protein [Scenedesmus sp. NREL 46B-D3]|nr:Bromodomain-containing protein [Scenedesmus sp. NREL 46B-D3]